MNNNILLRANNIYKSYIEGSKEKTVLKDINLEVSCGERIAIIGPSGSGKTTLLKILSALDTPTKGEVYFETINLSKLRMTQNEQLRLKEFGFVFQNYNLISTLTAQENIMLPYFAAHKSSKNINSILDKLNLLECKDLFPCQLSGGEQQRVAIARAMINEPKILFADEPTGNLDLENRDTVIKLLSNYCCKDETALIFVTHDSYLTQYATRVIHLAKL